MAKTPVKLEIDSYKEREVLMVTPSRSKVLVSGQNLTFSTSGTCLIQTKIFMCSLLVLYKQKSFRVYFTIF